MKTTYCSLGCFVGILVLLFVIPALAMGQLTGEELAQRVYDREVGKDMQMSGTMELISESGHHRSREFITMRKDTETKRMVSIRFTAPADIENTGFLVLEDTQTGETQQHLYLPALKRSRRIVASQQGRSFVNSDFTYEDMQRHPVSDWTYQLETDAEYLGEPCFVLVSVPKHEDKTQYSKIISHIDKTNFMPLKSEFWDHKGRHTKTYRVEKIEMIDGIATEIEVAMEDLSTKHLTRLQNTQIRYNSGLPDHLFSTRALER